ncbi:MAG: GAF domain-containing sensor histidine kinase [Anaerolineae bacterium]|jgi:signal transduction histidine kinase
MERALEVLPDVPAELDLSGRAAWQIQLRWFSSIGILEIRLRWIAGLAVLLTTWIATSILDVPLPPVPLYAVGLGILAYNAVLWFYFERRFGYPSRSRSSGYDYGAVLRYYWRELEREGISEADSFDRFVKVQTSLDWLAMMLLVHFSGGIQSPLLFFFVFHLVIASILLSRRACYAFATIAAAAVGVLAALEYNGLIPHVALSTGSTALYLDPLYVASVLFFFTTSLYIVVFLSTWLTASLRRRDEERLQLQQRLAGAYGLIHTLYDVTRTVSSTLDLQEVLERITSSAAEAMEAQACAIMLVDAKQLQVSTVASHGLGEAGSPSESIELAHSGYIRDAFSSESPVVIPDLSGSGYRYPVDMVGAGLRSLLCVPLIIRDKAQGVVCVYGTQGNQFVEDDAEFLAALASAGATAIENARAYQALEMADRAKSDFVRMMTHEFRSPLSAVQSMLRLMEQGFVGPLTEKQQDLIHRSQRRIAFMLNMVKDLLELAAGKMEMLTEEKTSLDLGAILHRVTGPAQASAAEKGLTFTVDLPEEPLPVLGFQAGLERAVNNLVSNAIKYTSQGGTVAVKAYREGDGLHLQVADTGIGIPEEAQARVFTEFFRAKNAKDLDVEGTGLGLVIAKEVIEELGGQISLRSTVGEGSTFDVMLPRGY